VLLSAAEIRRSVERAKAAFPRFVNWEHINAIDDSHPGFSVWGEFVPEPDEPTSRSFFVSSDNNEGRSRRDRMNRCKTRPWQTKPALKVILEGGHLGR